MARKRAKRNGQASGNGSNGADRIQYVSLSTETRRRYLNYALSVITSRALPDVRDGLKPVIRRILYAMYSDLRLTADSKRRKSAKIVGDTIGNYHPHGEMAVYEALVRLAQDFTLRCPLVDGQGNWGSLLGLPHAAERYTEARLTAIAEQLMNELRYQTVDMRANYDATREEPVVLPARFPNLLVNGTSGIAVGMATNIPPHNLSEVVKACVHLIANREATVATLMRFIKGPDFPLGGRIVTDRKALRQCYEEGRGAVKVRGEWRFDTRGRKTLDDRLVIHSVPFGVSTGPLIEQIGQIIESRRLPQLLGIGDETSDEHGLRIVLEIKPGTADAVLAYLFKHTPLEQNFAVNMTCLVPDEHGVMTPRRVGLNEMLLPFLDFRLATVRRRFEFQLKQLLRRIHILEGFEIVFNGLDAALKIIRASSGKQDAAQKLMAKFPLDEEQTMAILELQLYRLSQLEIDHIRGELTEKRAEAQRIKDILASDTKLWGVVQTELEDIAAQFGDKRRTEIGSSEEIVEFDPSSYIVRENTNVVLTAEGWIKRVGRLQSVETTRVREGDSVLAVVPGSTVDTVVFFASDGIAYTLPIDQVPPSSGYGEPLAKFCRMGDGVEIVSALSTDPRFSPEDKPEKRQPAPSPYLMVATAHGAVMRIPFTLYRGVSTKAGRKFCRLRPGDRVVAVELIRDHTTMFLATKNARVLHFKIGEVPVLATSGKGVRGIRLAEGDAVLGAVLLSRPSDVLRVVNTNDTPLSFGQMKYGVTSRGGKGIKTSQRNGFKTIVRPPVELVDWAAMEAMT